MFNPKKKCHVYWSNFFKIRVLNPKESDALKLYNWRKSQVVIMRRLQLLLDNGIDAALSYPTTELLPLSCGNNRRREQRIPVDPEEKAQQQKLHDMLKRDSEANAMIRKLAMMPFLYCSDSQYAEKTAMQEKLTKTYCWTDEQIRNEVGRFRRKMTSGK